MDKLHQLCKNKHLFTELTFVWGEDVVAMSFAQRESLREYLEKLLNEIGNVFVYMQHIIIVMDSTVDKFMQTLHTVGEKIRQSGFLLNPKLCRMCVPKLYYIGATISSDGIVFDDTITNDDNNVKITYYPWFKALESKNAAMSLGDEKQKELFNTNQNINKIKDDKNKAQTKKRKLKIKYKNKQKDILDIEKELSQQVKEFDIKLKELMKHKKQIEQRLSQHKKQLSSATQAPNEWNILLENFKQCKPKQKLNQKKWLSKFVKILNKFPYLECQVNTGRGKGSHKILKIRGQKPITISQNVTNGDFLNNIEERIECTLDHVIKTQNIELIKSDESKIDNITSQANEIECKKQETLNNKKTNINFKLEAIIATFKKKKDRLENKVKQLKKEYKSESKSFANILDERWQQLFDIFSLAQKRVLFQEKLNQHFDGKNNGESLANYQNERKELYMEYVKYDQVDDTMTFEEFRKYPIRFFDYYYYMSIQDMKKLIWWH